MRLEEQYKKEVLPKLIAKFGYKNGLSAPRIYKVAVNVGVGKYAKDKTYIKNVEDSLVKITGQKPVLTKAKKSVSTFKTRKGMIIGVMVTLRKKRMFDFIDKLINVSFPRIRDFRGINLKQVDRQGNLTIGFKEHVAFPEIGTDEVDNIFGLEISLATTAKTEAEGLELFRLMGFPFKTN
ncbi:50S ribosomal protein L5 [Candidatus Falkowbacteria bacterium CG_4_9_14_3_um_filter_36_9]|uniref:Large ribosomal subunit protein uL5 n=2 Tax=Candidatus Falkowiibacteriota TaxID=1752728 RepID=A0A1J4TEH4_9BACT|nr:MAG: 50S ribosomal protein L5 [Candidatus Falkowbacteria bacterium CG1_02_37_44]PIV51880.1 MAG: 50S ribosomal protein L5 [Candidatus Falkowbacteria bacterium CG02_land_8_20_14_3_00_36_14]PIX12081.1 MAG: 50S ribosomal protein L5 [Candidatus Falkowbacteria bacterium CG_4_8_14_3_um_filter_36_11]PJA10854.1 MAG: 50S ribosomal protein L5 [Candidatus Falkowbacteria bacterium CG_4_10_14_0_2_um_filter_36_22]PJB20211.1 MAG: 50S ribosomal protein L5 [Candidatus Falkowbacteria bacterium CG_4_9_14_3_um_f